METQIFNKVYSSVNIVDIETVSFDNKSHVDAQLQFVLSFLSSIAFYLQYQKHKNSWHQATTSTNRFTKPDFVYRMPQSCKQNHDRKC